MSFEAHKAAVGNCRLCASDLATGARPIIQLHRDARILVASQAPGSKAHASGIPFDDPSGDRLRDWMGIDRSTFYDEKLIAILPMAFCYPGKGKSGDLPPMPICAKTWRSKLLAELPNLKLSLLVGKYAQAWHLSRPQKNLTETVLHWGNAGKDLLPLPHPSPRNNIWLQKNPWFELKVLPELKRRVVEVLS